MDVNQQGSDKEKPPPSYLPDADQPAAIGPRAAEREITCSPGFGRTPVHPGTPWDPPGVDFAPHEWTSRTILIALFCP